MSQHIEQSNKTDPSKTTSEEEEPSDVEEGRTSQSIFAGVPLPPPQQQQQQHHEDQRGRKEVESNEQKVEPSSTQKPNQHPHCEEEGTCCTHHGKQLGVMMPSQRRFFGDKDVANEKEAATMTMTTTTQTKNTKELRLAPAMEPGALEEAYAASSSSSVSARKHQVTPVEESGSRNSSCTLPPSPTTTVQQPGAVRVPGRFLNRFREGNQEHFDDDVVVDEEVASAAMTPIIMIAAEVVEPPEIVVAMPAPQDPPANWCTKPRSRKLVLAVSLVFAAIGITVLVTVLRAVFKHDDVSPSGPLWMPLGQDMNGEMAGDRFGYSVSLSASGTVVAIGTPFHSSNGTNKAGHVRVYKLEGETWIQAGSDLVGDDEYDHFGHSVSLAADGTTVAVGAAFHIWNQAKPGYVRVYRLEENEWIQAGGTIYGEAAGDGSGVAVSLSADGTTVAIGATGNDGSGPNAGHGRVYQIIMNDNEWNQVGSDLDGEAENDNFGHSVSLSADGTRVAISAYSMDSNGTIAGIIRVHQLDDDGSEWIQLGSELDDGFGGTTVSLSADGTSVAIGAHDMDRVRVFVFWMEGDEWIQVGSDLYGEAVGDGFGGSISLSGDGTAIAIGAPYNNGNGAKSGHVRVYQFRQGDWVQAGDDLDGEDAVDWFGSSVSLSLDGTTVAIGAIKNRWNGSDAGRVRVYRWGEL